MCLSVRGTKWDLEDTMNLNDDPVSQSPARPASQHRPAKAYSWDLFNWLFDYKNNYATILSYINMINSSIGHDNIFEILTLVTSYAGMVSIAAVRSELPVLITPSWGVWGSRLENWDRFKVVSISLIFFL